ncbi:MAG: stage III sporulation protein AA [Bacillota bacterium]|nr:MAG: stage III sporulation protein AA [Bacillota bacterium]
MSEDLWSRAEEIRLRRERPLSVVTATGDVWLSPRGLPAQDHGSAYWVTAEDTRKTLSLVSQGSVYALEEEFRNGFVTVPGGHRVGLVGRALLEAGRLRTITHVAGLSFRLSREVRGAAGPVLGVVVAPGGGPRSTLVISPPGCGKTTFLRDLVRLLSDGSPDAGFRGFRVGLVDERSEIAACYEGVPQRDVGLRTDVLDACPKAEGVLLLLRAMSPEVIAADEIGRPEDATALTEAASAGAAVLATAHGSSVRDLASRPMLAGLLRSGLFEVCVVLSRRNGPGTVESVTTGRGPGHA